MKKVGVVLRIVEGLAVKIGGAGCTIVESVKSASNENFPERHFYLQECFYGGFVYKVKWTKDPDLNSFVVMFADQKIAKIVVDFLNSNQRHFSDEDFNLTDIFRYLLEALISGRCSLPY